MSELQGPRILGEERSGRRRSLWWIIAGVVALLPLALLMPFACQTLRRGPDSQSRVPERNSPLVLKTPTTGKAAGGSRRLNETKLRGPKPCLRAV